MNKKKLYGRARRTLESETGGIGETKKVTKALYYDLKRRLLQWEKNNYTQLAVLEDTNGMYKMFDHSAVIFVAEIARRLKMRAELVADTDFEMMSDKKVCLIHDMKVLERRLEKEAGIRRTSSELGVVVYNLGYKIEPGDYLVLEKQDEILRKNANKLVLPNEIYPSYRFELKKLARVIYEAVRKMDPIARTITGDEMLKSVVGLLSDFVEVANGHEDMDEYLARAVKTLRVLDANIMTAMEMEVLDAKKSYIIIVQISKTQKKLAGVLQQREQERKIHDKES